MSTLSDGESGELLKLISGVNRQFEQTIEARLKPSGLPIEQYRVLEALDRHDGQSMGELAVEVFVDSPTLTKIIDRMIANADVYRAPDPNDRRKVLVFRSDKGAQTLLSLRAIVKGSQSGIVNRLDRHEASQLRSLLRNMLGEA
ncbi:DNA-binding MarR family transcriptional regulator [Rhizobium sp. PP-F2F-G38]|uniref:MarR family winged helix-turn-helix transcriptional regulator n=1 Tax=Rhizobium sp. PP-CC-3G-465 TaxID=2135648 RepID=UPI000D889640|nr:DNA-binding MarR family transcriptional regulator [Rhizobium sp. PP-WC-1G-195]PYE94915.1 DNA-binding MarR family transcriptional regulator [Rhizobium sp. PP-F2F-G38]TCL92290.1 DNA-binding MarR family transcriptional regulator [Rhizobium sp. PP-WC-2G-219]TCP82107.1 DNA-binding MarR family transcriptional regulator [Rhizobium sp. PP-CC-2G-626]TCQ03113.1 DNA-binding MarR family transcriptional regulator [Rhizobium sp. PP-F2F-G36]TCQ25905.1 DNA-binding MarR family transcriptional regulator [Rhi